MVTPVTCSQLKILKILMGAPQLQPLVKDDPRLSPSNGGCRWMKEVYVHLVQLIATSQKLPELPKAEDPGD